MNRMSGTLFCRPNLDKAIHALVLIRFGQELGTDTELTRTIARTLDALLGLATKFFG